MVRNSQLSFVTRLPKSGIMQFTKTAVHVSSLARVGEKLGMQRTFTREVTHTHSPHLTFQSLLNDHSVFLSQNLSENCCWPASYGYPSV